MINTSHKTAKLILESVLRIKSEIVKLNKIIEDDDTLTPKTKNDTWNLLAPFFALFEWGQYLDGVVDSLRSYINLKGKMELKDATKKFNENKQDYWPNEE